MNPVKPGKSKRSTFGTIVLRKVVSPKKKRP
jgi:hypothetical protein